MRALLALDLAKSKQQERSAGACRGTFDLIGLPSRRRQLRVPRRPRCLVMVRESSQFPCPAVEEFVEQPQQALFLVPHTKSTSRAPSQFVDFQLDVSASGIELAVREGFESVEHVKRYTALGFGTDQGKLGNINGMAILANALDQTYCRDRHHDLPSLLYARLPLAQLPAAM